MSKPTYHLPRCTCGHLARYYRSTDSWKCCYCPATFTPKEAEALYDVPEVEEQTFDIDSPQFDMFKRQTQTITAPAPVMRVKPIEQTIRNEPLYPDLVTDTDVPDTEVWTPSFNENAIDVNEIFSYHHGSKDEPKSQPPKFKMPVMQPEPMRQTATSEAPTGSSMYFSLRSDK